MQERLAGVRRWTIAGALTLLLSLAAKPTQAAFTTVISSPPDSIQNLGQIESNTQLNLYAGALLSTYFYLEGDGGAIDNIEVNLLGGTVDGSLQTSGTSHHNNTNVVFNIHSGTVGDSVWIDNGNVANVTGGAIDYMLNLRDRAVGNVSGGTIGQLAALHTSRLNLFGGDFRLNGIPLAGLQSPGDSRTVNIPAGSLLTGVLADGTPLTIADQGTYRDFIDAGAMVTLRAVAIPSANPTTIHLPGGQLPRGLRAGQRLVVGAGAVVPKNYSAAWGSLVDVAGGQIGDHFEAVGAVVNLSDGQIGGQAAVFRGAVVNMSGGSVGSNFAAATGSSFHMTGGTVEELFEAYGDSNVTLAGGVVRPHFIAHPESRVSLVGRNFRVNGVLVGGLNEVGNERQVDLPAGAVLSGTFADGRQFAFSDQVFDYFAAGTITLRATSAPAPGHAVIRVPSEVAPAGLRSGQSLIVADGGSIGNDFNADWGSLVAIDGGQVGGGFEAVGAMINVTAGYVGWGFDAFFGSAVNISGGIFEGVVRAHHGSVINVSGGHMGPYLTANSGGAVNVTGGAIGYAAQVNQGGALNVSGGEIGQDLRVGGGMLNMSGGSIGDRVYLFNDGVANLSGGTIGDQLIAHNGARLVITGGDFRLNGLLIDNSASAGPSAEVIVPAGALLSGTLRDGTPFAFSDQDGDSFEPGSVRIINYFDVSSTAPVVEHHTGRVPTGVRAGQSIVVDASRTLGDRFNAGWGSAVTVAGGAIGENFEAVGAQVLLASGSIGDNFDAFYGSVVTIAGGEVGGQFETHNGSTVNITGGRIDDHFTAKDGSVVNISGGEMYGSVAALAGSLLNVSGGRVGDWFQMESSAELNLFGTEFWLNGQPFAELLPGESISLGVNQLTGPSTELRALLSDGSIFQTYLFAELFEEVPGPNGPVPATRVTLNSVMTADFNGDRLVDAADLAHWKNSFGVGADGNDFLAWQRQFNRHATSPARTSVPEPASHCLLTAMTVSSILLCRRAKHTPL